MRKSKDQKKNLAHPSIPGLESKKHAPLVSSRKLEGIDKDFIRRGAEKITDDDVRKVTERTEEIKKKFSRGGPLSRFIEDLELLLAIVRDFWTGKYRKVPYWAIAAIVFALLYVLNPFDIIPDMIPVVGYLDDAAVVAVCLLLVEQELEQYKAWKTAQ